MPFTATVDGTSALSFVNAALPLLILPGFGLLTCGLVQRKNAAHLVMLTFSAYVFAVLAYYLVGYAVEFGGLSSASTAAPAASGSFLIGHGGWGVIGGSHFFLRGAGRGDLAIATLALGFLLAASCALVGAVCERITFGGFLLCDVFLAGVLYPIFGCWVWGGGWLAQTGVTMGLGHGFVDFAGSSVVHTVAGFGAMALSILLGPRLGKYALNRQPRAFPAHNIVFVVIGALLLLIGLLGLELSAAEPGSGRVGAVVVNTNIAAAAGAAAAMLYWQIAFGKPDISMACNGLLAGLVSISASCAFVGPIASMLIGAVAGLVVSAGVLLNERILKIDDPCGSIAVHGYCGWLGAVALGIFADGSYGAGWNGVGATAYLGRAGAGVTGLLYGDPSQFEVQLAGATLCAVYALVATYLVFKLADHFYPIRAEAEAEVEGLDLPQFGMLAYGENEQLPG